MCSTIVMTYITIWAIVRLLRIESLHQTMKPKIQDSGLGCLELRAWDIACGSWDMRFSNDYHILHLAYNED
jgi:hypothetical protein